MAVTSPSRSRRGPRAATRRAFRHPASLPRRAAGVEVLAAVKHARGRVGRLHEWDARLETSAIAVLAYLWRRGRGEKWAGCNGSARFGCSLAQLVIGLAPIMGWRGIPDRGDEQAVARFVKRHRKSVQRWLDWLQLAGLVSHTPQQDEEGFWWRTIIELHPVPQLPAELLQEAVDRRAGWTARERRRDARGRRAEPHRHPAPGPAQQRRRDAPEASPAAVSWRATPSVSGCVPRWPTALLTRLRHM